MTAPSDGPGQAEMRDLLRGLAVFDAALDPEPFDSPPVDPSALFRSWFHDAVGVGEPEPHAMTLSTVDADGNPDARVLILKDLDDSGWWFAGSAATVKGVQLAARPAAALTFHWKRLGRQVLVAGPVTTAPPDTAARDFRARSSTARAVALTGRHGPLGSRRECEETVAAATQQLRADPDLVAPDWTVYAVVARTVEFWQADRGRLHHRLRYTRRTPDGWDHDLWWP